MTTGMKSEGAYEEMKGDCKCERVEIEEVSDMSEVKCAREKCGVRCEWGRRGRIVVW